MPRIADKRTAEYDEGYDDGYTEGQHEGWQEGYDKGYSEGREEGYEEGFSNGLLTARQRINSCLEIDRTVIYRLNDLLRG